MGVFTFLKKNESAPAVGPLTPPMPPPGLPALPKPASLPPLPAVKAMPAVPPAASIASLPPLPPLQTQTPLERTFSTPLPPPKAVGVPQIFKTDVAMPMPATPPPGPPREAPSLPPLTPPSASQLPELPAVGKPKLPELPQPARSEPRLPELPIRADAPKPLPKLDELPRISVSDVRPPLPALPGEKADSRPALPPLPEVSTRPGGKLQKLLEDLSFDSFELPALDTYEKPPTPTPHFEPMMSRSGLLPQGPLFIAMDPYETTLAQVKTVATHLHTIQSHNEKLGHIENTTKTSLDTLSDMFESMQRHLLAIDEKLFKVN